MLRRADLLAAFEKHEMRREPPDHMRNLRLVEALRREARSLGRLPPQDPLEGIDVDIWVAKVLNVRTDPGAHQPGA
jgi:hypothetical protein